MPQIIIDYHRGAIAQFRLNIEDVNRAVNTAFAGQSSGLVFEGEKRFELVVRLETDQRKSLEDVRNLLIPTPLGTQVPLYQLADVTIRNGPNQIQREDAKRRIVVGFNVGGRDVQSIVHELQDKVDAQLNLPVGYYITYGGAFENLIAARQRLGIAVPISLVMIFLLLFFAFNSMRHGLLIYTAIPLSAIGGIFFLAFRGMPFSISAGVGFIALFGVAVLNGIVLIAEFNRLKHDGLTDLHRIVLMGTKVRLRPVMMTAFVASLGFLPMALSQGAGAEVQRPLATVVIGGLLIATLLTLFVLPVLYIMFEKSGRSNSKNKIGIVAFLCAVAFLNESTAQDSLTLEQAINLSLQNNLQIKSEKLIAEYHQKLSSVSGILPQTGFTAEFGQINSAYGDNRFGISQSLSFPTVYARQRKVNEEEWKSAVLSVSLREEETKRAVIHFFYTMLVLKEKEKLLKEVERSYAAWLEKAEWRVSLGESYALEKTTAGIQLGEIRQQLSALQYDMDVVTIQLQLLLHTTDPIELSASSLKLEDEFLKDSSMILIHPQLRMYAQQQVIARSVTEFEKSKRLPELQFGYFNASMQGTGADDVYYTGSKRFSAAQVGIGIPIFQHGQKTITEASKIKEVVAETHFEQQKQNLIAAYREASMKHQISAQAVAFYENEGLHDAKLIRETADRQFDRGEIDFLQWMMLIHQVIAVHAQYLDACMQLNESIITLNYLTFNQN